MSIISNGVHIRVVGDWMRTEIFLKKSLKFNIRPILDRYGELGVKALRDSTPKDTGITADSWYYEIRDNGPRKSIVFLNHNVNQHVNIALILQYGHGTGTGGYVEGIDYINPALEPIFKQLADEAWKEVANA